MCRNIKTLFNFEPPATDEEIHDASLQFVRKLSGFTKPSKVNEDAFERAVEEIARAARTLVDSLVTKAPPSAGSETVRPGTGGGRGPLIGASDRSNEKITIG